MTIDERAFRIGDVVDVWPFDTGHTGVVLEVTDKGNSLVGYFDVTEIPSINGFLIKRSEWFYSSGVAIKAISAHIHYETPDKLRLLFRKEEK